MKKINKLFFMNQLLLSFLICMEYIVFKFYYEDNNLSYHLVKLFILMFLISIPIITLHTFSLRQKVDYVQKINDIFWIKLAPFFLIFVYVLFLIGEIP